MNIAIKKESTRIHDLGNPDYTELQLQALNAAPPVEMRVEAVLDAARAMTGLSDFGAPDFKERLEIWLESLDEDRGLSPLGRATMFGECVRYASTRLKLEDLYKRHPEIDDIVMDRPIMIAGLPRSGTTHLVNILGVDPRLRSMPLWESMEPIPAEGEVAGPDGADPRLVRTRQFWGAFEETLPLMPSMHEMAPDHVHEDIDLQAIDFSSYLPEWLSRPYRWRDHYYASDQTPHYGYGKRVMKAMTWLRGPNRWLMKSPPHMENFGPLIKTYPDAIVPVTHRDPVAVLQSAITMIAYGDRMRRSPVDLRQLASYWIARIERLLHRCVADRHLLPDNQSVDVLFHEYMADQKGVVSRIYALADLEMTPETEARIDGFLAANPRGKHGQVQYDLIGDFGVDIGAVRERFQFYYDRFPVRLERVAGEKA